jgi:Xaa-Pro aminopeptidase
LLIDWGTKLGGYASDLTRTFHFGNPPDRYRSAYQAVLDAQIAAIEAIAPGAECRKVDATARESLEKAGFGEYFVHGLGHGIGLQVHESPRFSSVSDEVLEPGMVVTVEPGVYFEGEFGIRIEDDVLVTETGFEVLSTLPKGLDDCRLML